MIEETADNYETTVEDEEPVKGDPGEEA
jgi:hypothetical protein